MTPIHLQALATSTAICSVATTTHACLQLCVSQWWRRACAANQLAANAIPAFPTLHYFHRHAITLTCGSAPTPLWLSSTSLPHHSVLSVPVWTAHLQFLDSLCALTHRLSPNHSTAPTESRFEQVPRPPPWSGNCHSGTRSMPSACADRRLRLLGSEPSRSCIAGYVLDPQSLASRITIDTVRNRNRSSDGRALTHTVGVVAVRAFHNQHRCAGHPHATNT